MAAIDSQPIRVKKPWGITLLGVIAIAGLVAMPLLVGAPDPEKMPDLVRFFGRFHPVLLHLPIGVFALILMQELGYIFGKNSTEPRQTSQFPMLFGAGSAIIAVLAGFLLYQGEDYGESAVISRHLWGGIAFACAAVLTLIVKSWTIARAGNPAFYRTLLFGSVGIMGFASHDGATITHGEGYLTQYAPSPIREILVLESKKPEKPAKTAVATEAIIPVIYTDLVAPILERRCVQCHKEGKAKGKLRMDTFEMLVKGGKEGPAFEAGNSANSNIIIRPELPEDDEEHMPPEGKKDIEDYELAVLKWWIDSGADPTKTTADFEIPAPIKEAISKLLPASATAAPDVSITPPEKIDEGPDAALQAAVAAIALEFPGALNFEAQGTSDLTFTAVSLRGSFDDAGFAKLEKFLPQLVSLDLSASKITDQSLAKLTTATKLRILRLAETDITDGGIDHLLKLDALESINLYGTKITDAGVSKLAALPNLKRLYLWQTAVTPEAIEALKQKLPSCDIIIGAGA